MHVSGLSSIRPVLLKDPASAPLWVAVGFGVALSSVYGVRCLVANPDVRTGGARSNQFSGDTEKGSSWHNHLYLPSVSYLLTPDI